MSQFERNLPPKKGKSTQGAAQPPQSAQGERRPPQSAQGERRGAQNNASYERRTGQSGAQAKRAPAQSAGVPSPNAQETSVYVRKNGAPGAKPPNAQRPKKKKKSIFLRVVLIVFASIFLLIVGTGAFLYNSIRTEIAPEEGGYTPEEIGSIPEYTGEGVTNFLVCGIDYDNESADGYTSEEHVGRTDMILYVRYDTIENKVVLMQLPRDVFVGSELETGGTGKINSLYYYAEDPNNRMEPLSRAVYDQLGLPVDFYVTLDMDALKEIIDHPPGYISVYVPMDVMDPNNPEAIIPAGWRDFTSDEAEFFLRNRTSPSYEGMSDIMRLQMQQSFYSALYREFTELTPQDLLMWMRVLLYRVNTDMDPVQLGGLAQKALNLESSDITFIRPPVAPGNYGEHSVLSLEPQGTADLLNQYLRPADQSLSVDELDIHTVAMDQGVIEANIRTMTDIQSIETGTVAAESGVSGESAQSSVSQAGESAEATTETDEAA